MKIKERIMFHFHLIDLPVKWQPVNSYSSSKRKKYEYFLYSQDIFIFLPWSQYFNDKQFNGAALANSRLAICQSRIRRSATLR